MATVPRSTRGQRRPLRPQVQPAPDQIIDQLVGQDDNIGGLAGEQAQPHRMHAAKDRRATTCMLALELLGGALDHCLRGTRAENVESLHI